MAEVAAARDAARDASIACEGGAEKAEPEALLPTELEGDVLGLDRRVGDTGNGASLGGATARGIGVAVMSSCSRLEARLETLEAGLRLGGDR